MAHWKPKTVKGRTYVFVYTYRAGRQTQVKPRSSYAHLDAFLPDPAQHHNIDTWVADWAAKNEKTKKPEAAILFSDDRLAKYIADYETYLRVRRGRSDKTYGNYSSWLRRYVVPYFLSLPQPLKDPQTWPGASIRLLDYLENRGCNPPLIRGCNNALRGLWTWLLEEHLVTGSEQLHLRAPLAEDDEGATPLPRPVPPEEVLQFVRTVTRKPAKGKHKQSDAVRNAKLLALLGYFFSLRPQESFGLTPADFRAGPVAQALACGKAMQGLQLFDRLAVDVQRQRTHRGSLTPPKAHSKGYVSCFNAEAAQLLVGLLNEQADTTKGLFKVRNRELYKQWALVTEDTSLADIDLKDLRRASLYYLGHETGFQGAHILLMKHARHKEFETTMLYLRRPEECAPAVPGKLDLGA